jgi:hypothetical protein
MNISLPSLGLKNKTSKKPADAGDKHSTSEKFSAPFNL